VRLQQGSSGKTTARQNRSIPQIAMSVGDAWTDIDRIDQSAKERLGTQHMRAFCKIFL
jgi:hypothetical protein